MTQGHLPATDFRQALSALPLVSIDLCVTDPRGRLLLGLRRNAPARGWWFTPGGRIRKNEPLAWALQRVARHELGVPAEVAEGWVSRARLMGAWDHFYDDSAFDPAVSTHYVNLPHWLALGNDEVAALRLEADDQHSAWRWAAVGEAAADATVHPYVRVYAEWVGRELVGEGGVGRSG